MDAAVDDHFPGTESPRPPAKRRLPGRPAGCHCEQAVVAKPPRNALYFLAEPPPLMSITGGYFHFPGGGGNLCAVYCDLTRAARRLFLPK